MHACMNGEQLDFLRWTTGGMTDPPTARRIEREWCTERRGYGETDARIHGMDGRAGDDCRHADSLRRMGFDARSQKRAKRKDTPVTSPAALLRGSLQTTRTWAWRQGHPPFDALCLGARVESTASGRCCWPQPISARCDAARACARRHRLAVQMGGSRTCACCWSATQVRSKGAGEKPHLRVLLECHART